MNDPRFRRAPRVLLVCDHLVRYAAGVGEGLRAQGANVALVTRDHAEDFGGDGQAMRDEVTARLGADAPVWWLPGRVRDRNAVPVAAEVLGVIAGDERDVGALRAQTLPDPGGVAHEVIADEEDARRALESGIVHGMRRPCGGEPPPAGCAVYDRETLGRLSNRFVVPRPPFVLSLPG